MKIYFADDSRHNKNITRKGMGAIIAIGGICIESNKLSSIEKEIESICQKVGFPPNEAFKWSTSSDMWMRKNLLGDDRINFFTEILSCAKKYKVEGLVVIEDAECKTASGSTSVEHDAMTLFLERVEWHLGSTNSEGIVILSKPSGGGSDENKVLAECMKTLEEGTKYAELKRIALNVLTAPSKQIRLLQVADLITSCTTAHVAGHTKLSPFIFPKVKELLLRDYSDRIGGIGVKIHPDFKYANLYHWLLGDKYIMKHGTGHQLPLKGFLFYDGI